MCGTFAYQNGMASAGTFMSGTRDDEDGLKSSDPGNLTDGRDGLGAEESTALAVSSEVHWTEVNKAIDATLVEAAVRRRLSEEARHSTRRRIWRNSKRTKPPSHATAQAPPHRYLRRYGGYRSTRPQVKCALRSADEATSDDERIGWENLWRSRHD
ncbi:MAG TPA: hypothetical protein VMT88_01110 [Actinomycetes bacterium]|nr:hypothetical protein [Actinomycetes bacterium]